MAGKNFSSPVTVAGKRKFLFPPLIHANVHTAFNPTSRTIELWGDNTTYCTMLFMNITNTLTVLFLLHVMCTWDFSLIASTSKILLSLQYARPVGSLMYQPDIYCIMLCLSYWLSEAKLTRELTVDKCFLKNQIKKFVFTNIKKYFCHFLWTQIAHDAGLLWARYFAPTIELGSLALSLCLFVQMYR